VYAIHLEKLRKAYPGIEALRGISFEVRPGEVFGLLGPNGAGKTTVVRILATLSRATSGTAFVAGFDVLMQSQEVRRRIGYVAQTTALDLLATARENLQLHGQLFGLKGRYLQSRVEEMIDIFQLGEIAGRRAQTISGGMKRRLDLATGLLHKPQVLFLDEPTTGLDPENRLLLWEHVRGLASRDGIAVLLTTHYMEEADALASRLAIIDRGSIVVTGTPTELKSTLNGDVVTVELALAGRLDEACNLLQSLDGVTRVLTDTTMLFAQVPDGSIAVAQIVGALREKGIPLGRVSLNRPTLDEVYLASTGRKYRPGFVRSWSSSH
jgi:ABC-2 type transport system ATP-binding protein